MVGYVVAYPGGNVDGSSAAHAEYDGFRLDGVAVIVRVSFEWIALVFQKYLLLVIRGLSTLLPSWL